MQRLIRKVKLHVDVQLGRADDAAHLIAISNIRLDITQAPVLLFDATPSLRTARKQEGMHRQAHAWAQAPDTLRSVEMPGIVEDLRDTLDGEGENATWYLKVEMPGYGSYTYSVRPVFEASLVNFVVNEHIPD